MDSIPVPPSGAGVPPGSVLTRSTGRIACLENLEFLLSPQRGRFDFFVPRESTAAALVASSISPERLAWLTLRRTARAFLNDSCVLNQSDFTELLHRAGITRFVPSYRSSARLERWARDEHVSLLAPRWRLQQLLENKVLFDASLRAWGLPAPRHCLIASRSDVTAVPWYPCVVQLARGEGSGGTYFVRSRAELAELLGTRSFRYPLLAREFLRGRAFGVTVLVGETELVVSAIRAQSIDLEHRDDGFLATQWCPRREFGSRLLETMESVFAAVGTALRSLGFRGAAGLDFLVDGHRVLIIECNPRFTAATPQLASHPPLLHGLHFPSEHVRALTGQRLSAHRPTVPDSAYEGACVDFSAWVVPQMTMAKRRRVLAMPRIGIYDFDADLLNFVSEDLADLDGDHRLLFHYSTRLGARIGPRSDLGSLLSNFPVFDFSSGSAKLTPRSECLLAALRGEVMAPRRSSGGSNLDIQWPPISHWRAPLPLGRLG